MSNRKVRIIEGMRFSIKNWDKYQHYKKRNPPWVKLHNTILDDQSFYFLDPKSKLLYLLLLPFASKHENLMELNYQFLSSKMGIEVTREIITPLFARGFLLAERKRIASGSLAQRKQNGVSETEGETEKETEAERASTGASTSKKFSSSQKEEEENMSADGSSLYRESPLVHCAKCGTINYKLLAKHFIGPWVCTKCLSHHQEITPDRTSPLTNTQLEVL